MDFIKIVLIFVVSLIVTYVLTPFVKHIAINYGIIDNPGARKIHKEPIPRMGGLAIYFGFLISVLSFLDINTQARGIILGTTFIILVGLIDDIISLSPIIKLICQIIGAFIVISFGIKIEFMTNLIKGYGMFHLKYWGIPFTIIWIVGITNTINLIDGLDGLAAGLGFIASITLLLVSVIDTQVPLVAYLAAALAGSTLAFLKYNFYPASIFMGDSGSLLIGFILATISILGSLKSAALATLIIPMIVLAIPIIDTLYAIVRRKKANKSIFIADKEHFHHQFIAIGFSQKQTVLIFYFISICLGLCATLLTNVNDYYALITLFIVLTLLSFLIFQLKRIFKILNSEEKNENKAPIIKENEVSL